MFNAPSEYSGGAFGVLALDLGAADGADAAMGRRHPALLRAHTGNLALCSENTIGVLTPIRQFEFFGCCYFAHISIL